MRPITSQTTRPVEILFEKCRKYWMDCGKRSFAPLGTAAVVRVVDYFTNPLSFQMLWLVTNMKEVMWWCGFVCLLLEVRSEGKLFVIKFTISTELDTTLIIRAQMDLNGLTWLYKVLTRYNLRSSWLSFLALGHLLHPRFGWENWLWIGFSHYISIFWIKT